MTCRVKCDLHGLSLVSRIGQMRDSVSVDAAELMDPLSDMEIACGSHKKRTFRCHRVIFALTTDFFEALAASRSNSSSPNGGHCRQAQQITFALPQIDPSTFERVLDFIYTGELLLSVETVERVYKAAFILHLHRLRALCAEFMIDRLNCENCVSFWLTGEECDDALIIEAARNLFVRESRKLFSGGSSGSKTLKELTEDMMSLVLCDENLPVTSEVAVCDFLLQWIDARTAVNRTANAENLLPCIRWDGVHVEYIKSTLFTCKRLLASEACFQFLSKVLSYHWSGVPFPGLLTFQRRSVGLEKYIFSVGVNKFHSMSSDVLVTSLQTKNKASIESIPTKMADQASACVHNNSIYVSGVGESNKEVWKWDPICRWGRYNDMKTGRHRHCSVFVGSKLFLLGGYNKEEHVLVEAIESLDIMTNVGNKCSGLIYPVQTACCATHRTDVYVFGGLDGEHHQIDFIQLYDTVHDACSLLSVRMPKPCFLMRSALWEESAILIGKENCFVFDFEARTWKDRPQFRAGQLHFGLIIENGFLYIFGGGDYQTSSGGKTVWSFSDRVRSISVNELMQDAPTPIWTDELKLAEPCLIHAYGVISLPINSS